MRKNNIFTKGFTLAEVLITLGIIGIVASMTIPSLLANYQKNQTVTRLQKAYTELAQTKKLAEADNGTSDSWNIADASLASTTEYVNAYVYPYLKTIKKCNNGDTSCWTNPVSLDGTLAGGTNHVSTNYSDTLSCIAVGGYSVLFSITTPVSSVYYYIDIDGPNKGPGKLGKDVFAYKAFLNSPTGRSTLLPAGWANGDPIDRADAKSNSIYGCSNSTAGPLAGIYCSGLIMVDSWKIADDYPWK